MSVLLDTSFLIAVSVPTDANHAQAVALLMSNRERRLIPEVLLPELFHVIKVRAGYAQAVKMMQVVHASGLQTVPLQTADYERIDSILNAESEVAYDFGDAALLALAERLEITTLFTFDQERFAGFTPQHCPLLALKP